MAATALGPVNCTPCHLPQRLEFLSTEPEQVVSYEICPQISDLWIFHHVGRHRKFEVTQCTPPGIRDTACSSPSHLMPFCGPWTAGEKTLCLLYFGCLPRQTEVDTYSFLRMNELVKPRSLFHLLHSAKSRISVCWKPVFIFTS